MSEDDRRRGALGGLTAAANLTPDERVERARKGGRAAAANARAAREAAGLPPKPRTNRTKSLPDSAELEPYMQGVQAERERNGEPPLSYDALLRESALRLRRDVAQQTYDALRGDR